VFFDYGGANIGPGLVAEKEGTNQRCYKPEYMAKVNPLPRRCTAGTPTLTHSSIASPWACRAARAASCRLSRRPRSWASSMSGTRPLLSVIYTTAGSIPRTLTRRTNGHSVGHWEGDTLVVDTVGLNDETCWAAARRAAPSTPRFTATGTRHRAMDAQGRHHFLVSRGGRSGHADQAMVLGTAPRRIAADDDYIQPQMCIGYTKGHSFNRSAAVQDCRCGWCNPGKRLWRRTSNTITSPILADQEKARKKEERRERDGAGGECAPELL